jgi:hypothetical protein
LVRSAIVRSGKAEPVKRNPAHIFRPLEAAAPVRGRIGAANRVERAQRSAGIRHRVRQFGQRRCPTQLHEARGQQRLDTRRRRGREHLVARQQGVRQQRQLSR